MKLIKCIVTYILLFSSILIYCQNKIVNTEQTSSEFSKAINLFELQNYSSALNIFEKIYSKKNAVTYYEKSNTLYYLATCHKLVGDKNIAEIYFNDFLQKYPENIHNNEALFALGQLQFNNKAYKNSLETFQKIIIHKLDNSLLDEYYFKLGYCCLKSNMIEDAKFAFDRIKNSNTKYGYAASYYSACIAYDENKYKSALSDFEKLIDNYEFNQSAQQYIIRINSALGQYDEIVNFYNNYNKSQNKKDNLEDLKIFADAFYRTGNYQKSIELYEKLNTTLSTNDSYQLAFSYYNLGDYSKAIPYFEKVSRNNDSIGQNALYHVGICNLNINNKNFAASAFKDAYKMNIDRQITENSLFNYVKIAYETGFDPYDEAINTLQNYIEQKPSSNKLNEAYSYLAKLFLSTNNYQNALDIIDNLDVKTPELKTAYQKINYSSGIEKFNNKKYSTAINLLNKSKKYPQDKNMEAEATFWIGECYYHQNKFDKAISSYESFINMKNAKNTSVANLAYYSLGYCYFKNKNYTLAQKSFYQFIKLNNSSNPQMLCDALNRIGDCYFINHKYEDAIKSYNQAIKYNGERKDYSLYYKATALGAINKLEDKATTLQIITKMPLNTPLRSNALYELGNTYTLANNNLKAIEKYKQLIDEYPKTILTIKAKQKLGLIYYNINDPENAIVYLKDVIQKYPGTKEANECLASLKNIYVENNNVDEYLDFVDNTAHIKTSVTEADSLNFESAQKLFMSEKYNNAKNAFTAYLKKYPNGAYKTEANYYIAECYANENNYDNALENYITVYEANNSLYTENAKIKAAKIYQTQGDYKTAAQLYMNIINNTEYDYIANEANAELMRCYFKLSEYNDLLSVSEIVMNNSTNKEDVINEAKYYHAYSMYKLGNFDNAYKEFSIISTSNQGERSAEAKYYCCNIKYITSKYKEAETETFELVQKYAEYDYWTAKGFILLADIYVKEDNVFQARQTLQSIIDNYNGEDLKQEAQNKLNKLNENE